MRQKVTKELVHSFMKGLARKAKGPGSVYLTGGSTLLLLDVREQTIDIDIKLDPEPPGVFEAIAELKEELNLNIELAAPDDFIPAPKKWREYSTYIDSINGITFYHFDLVLQALAKIERSHSQDLTDVTAMLQKDLISISNLLERFEEINSRIIRYPSVNAEVFKSKIDEFILNYKEQNGS